MRVASEEEARSALLAPNQCASDGPNGAREATAGELGDEVVHPASQLDDDIFPHLNVPPMRIAVLLVGTIGDTMPFIQLAKVVQERYGHVVRIATHNDLRGPVDAAGVRFYPLAGNAQQLAAWGPSFSLRPLQLLEMGLRTRTIYQLAMMRKIMLSCISACTEPDPEDPHAEPFHADVIMSNPMSLGHVHVAEALGIPLHLFFPNPWVATQLHPHSFAGWSYHYDVDPTAPTGYRWTPKPANHLSYVLTDYAMWHFFIPFTNELRSYCGLRTLRPGFFGGTVVRDNRVPFSQMWSPSLSPRPPDWPPEANVVGFFFWDQKASEVDESAEPWASLCAWLEVGAKPIFVGFGSMVFDGPKVARLICDAAVRAGVRVIMQTATAGGSLALPAGETLPPNVYTIGRCPHDWILPKMAAVVHHAGAGTVAAGLRLGLPSLGVPFFGDQFFYAHAMAGSGVGPSPVPFAELTVDKLAAALGELPSLRFREGAQRMAAKMAREDGLGQGIAEFHRHLPLADMVCDVAVLLGETGGLARHHYPKLGIKVSDEVHQVLTTAPSIDQSMLDGARPHRFKEWYLGAAVSTTCGGVFTGAMSFAWELLNAVLGLIRLPCAGLCNAGCAGLLLGICSALLLLVLRLVYAPIILVDRLVTGCFNGCCADGRAGEAGSRRPRWNHCWDPEAPLTTLAQCPKGKGSGRDSCCGELRCMHDAGHADGRSRLPLHGPLAPASAERRAAIDAAFHALIVLRRAYDTLAIADRKATPAVAQGVASSEEPQPHRLGTGPLVAAPSIRPDALSPERLSALAEHVRAFERRRRQTHTKFTEYVMLWRDLTSRPAEE